eukprot:CAMPEP_0196579082 /NCGR_PEP_ID=MMETSP1081-20130531/17638_1 /TAXON_ID=36882 /ORGANISM="Pyramimonas amylifera, Strain CCMP720" /LENGTH=172 /DNA_ID=CAMNT_0041898539 /DNA_START=205 /DNA_END=720 /DNA_ORIENTATION=-
MADSVDPYELTWESLVYTDGSLYQGLAMGGLPHGRGNLLYCKGDRYEGDFFGGSPEGFGLYIWPDGSKYSGRWRSGRLHGCGRKTHSNGQKEEGEFLEDTFIGQQMGCSDMEVEVTALAGETAAKEAKQLLIKPLEDQVRQALKDTGVQRIKGNESKRKLGSLTLSFLSRGW